MYKLKYYKLSSEEKNRIIEKLRNILVAEGVKLAILFGSFTEANSFRDIDIAIYLDDPEDINKILELATKLEEKLELPIDLTPLQALPPKLRLQVLTKGQILVEKPGLYEATLTQTTDELTTMNKTTKKTITRSPTPLNNR